MQENNQPKGKNLEPNNNPGNLKQDMAKNIGSKVASGAMQASGVPKPLADVAGKAASNMMGNHNPLKRGGFGPGLGPNGIGSRPNYSSPSINNGLKSAKNTNPSAKSDGSNIGKGSHPSQNVSSFGNNNKNENNGKNDENKSPSQQIGDKLRGGNNNNPLMPSSLGHKDSLDENGNEKSPSSKLLDGAKGLLGLPKKPPKDAPESVKLIYKTKFLIKIGQLIAPIMPFIIACVAALLIVFMVMSQVMILRDKINETLTTVTTGIEKFVNYASGQGWQTEEQKFYKTLKEKYESALKEPTGDGKPLFLDIPLIAATINYSKVSDIGMYENQNEENLGGETDGSAEGVFGDFFASYYKNSQMRNFYYVANDKLGDYHSLVPGNRRLIGHMINYRVKWDTYSLGEAAKKWVEFFGRSFSLFTESLVSDIEQIFNIKLQWFDYIPGIGNITILAKQIVGIVKFLKEIDSYDSLGNAHDTYFEYHWRNIAYEFEELIYKIVQGIKEIAGSFWNTITGNNEITEEQVDKGFFDVFPAPSIEYYETTDMNKIYEYGHYLRNVYIPGTFYSDVVDFNPATADTSVREIYQQKKYYEYLVGDLGRPDGIVSGQNCDDCTYNLSKVNTGSSTMSPGDEYANIANLKVRLLAWYNTAKRGQVMVEGIPFETYVLGVTYAEVGDGVHEEALKSEAVAARSFALVRPFVMGNSQYCNYKKEGDGWVLTLRGSTADQVYCDPDQGCSSDHPTIVNNKDLYPGLDHGRKYKDPLSQTADQGQRIKAAVGATAGQVLVDGSGAVTIGEYLDVDQNAWQRRANSGEKYTTILPSHYSNKYGQTITLGNGNCSRSDNPSCTGGGETGDWANWRQGDPRWGSIPLGSSTIAKIGCAATSVAIQLARSGAAVTFSDLNPGTFVTAYKAAGGFTGGNIYFDRVNKVAPDFTYQGRVGLSGGESSKVSQVKRYLDQNYYVIMEVKKGNNSGQHWVAIISSDGTSLKMADPASAETNASSKYPSAGWSEIVYYKKG